MFEAIPFPEALTSRTNIGLREAIQFTRIYNDLRKSNAIDIPFVNYWFFSVFRPQKMR
jgi:hypothetical protein